MDYQLLFKKAKQLGFEDVEVYQVNSINTRISTFNGEIDKSQSSESNTFSLRGLYKNGQMASLVFENSDEDVDQLLEKLTSNAQIMSSDNQEFIFAGSENYPTLNKVDADFTSHTMGEKINMLKVFEEEAKKADPRIVVVPTAMYNESAVTVRIVNSKGLDISKNISYLYAGGQTVSKEGEETKTAFKVRMYPRYADIDPVYLGTEASKAAVEKLGGQPCDSGKYQIVMENEAMGDLLGAFTSMFSGEAALKKVSLLVGKENTKVFGDNVTIVDNPLEEGSLFSQPFDDEGVACYNKDVVKNGVFKGFLHNLKTAKHFNTTSTGSGSKTSGGSIGVSGCNTYLVGGNYSKEEIIASVEKGIYINDVGGLHAGVNPISGDFSVQSSGFMIENGKLTSPVTLIVLSGNFINIMNNVEMLGNDVELGQNSVSAPTVKFKEMLVSGK